MGNITNANGRFQLKRDFQENWNAAASNKAIINPGELVGIYIKNVSSQNGASFVNFSTDENASDVIYVQSDKATINNNELKIDNNDGAEEIIIYFVNKTNSDVIIKNINDNNDQIELKATNTESFKFHAQSGAAEVLTYQAIKAGGLYHSVSVKIGDSNNLKGDGKTYSETPYVANIKAGEGYGAVQQAGPNEEYGQASGAFSAAFGKGTVAKNDYEVAFGKYNLSKDDTVFSIGNGDGDDEEKRKNLLELNKDGKLTVANLMVGEQELNADTIGDLIQNGGGGSFIVEFEDSNGHISTDVNIDDIEEELNKGKIIIGKYDERYYSLVQFNKENFIVFTSLDNDVMSNEIVQYYITYEADLDNSIKWTYGFKIAALLNENNKVGYAEKADEALIAYEDENGNNIAVTYATNANVNATKAPIYHAITDTDYGVGDSEYYGHVRLFDELGDYNEGDGRAATPYLVKDVKESIEQDISDLSDNINEYKSEVQKSISSLETQTKSLQNDLSKLIKYGPEAPATLPAGTLFIVI